MGSLRDRLETFGWDVSEVDGHDAAAMVDVLASAVAGPRVVILRTVKGKGVSFMENQMEWHYLPLTEELYAQAVAEVGEQ